MIFGKIIAGAIGALVAGVPGALFGVAVGHLFDRGLRHSLLMGSPEQVAALQKLFFETSFLLLGQVAKADGRVSEVEVAQTENIMAQLGVEGNRRNEAIALFKRGAAGDFDLQATLERFREAKAGHSQLGHTLLVFLVSLALADGRIEPEERQALENIAAGLGYSTAAFGRLLKMLEAQSHFHGGQFHQQYGSAEASPADSIADAYAALGVDPDCSDRELKRAYRKLMSQHHPDKLIAQGVPEEMVRLGTEKSQEIQAAYELVRRQRSGG